MAEIVEMPRRPSQAVAIPVPLVAPPPQRPSGTFQAPVAVPQVPRPHAGRSERAEAGEQWIARLLRGGALCSGALFLGSLALETLPASETLSALIDVLRKAAASALLVTPVVSLMVAGTTLGLRGEWRYALYAAGVLALLAVAVGAGFHA